MIPLYGGFLNCGYPKIQYIVYNGKSIYQWMIWVHLHFRKPPYDHMFPWLHRNLFSSPVFCPSQPPWSHPALLQVTMKSRYLAQLPPGFKISKVGEFAMSDEKITLFSIILLRKSCFHIAPSKLSVGISYRIYLRRRIAWFIIFPKVQSLFSQKKKLDESDMMRTSDSNPTLLVCWPQSSIHFWLT